jgi:hypothetical protein
VRLSQSNDCIIIARAVLESSIRDEKDLAGLMREPAPAIMSDAGEG